MKLVPVMLKDLRLVGRDHLALIGVLVVPIVVIMVIAVATQPHKDNSNIIFPVVNEDRGPVAASLINSFTKRLDVRLVSRPDAIRMVAGTNKAPAALILPPELSKHYLAEKPCSIELLTDPAQWQELGAVKVAMLIAARDTASLNDPLSHELLTVREDSLTSDRLSFTSLEQSVPGFSLMFVLLTLLFSVSLGLREEEVWGTSTRLRVAPVPLASLLGGKLLTPWIIGTAQLLLLLLFGHFVYGLELGHSTLAIVIVAAVAVASMTCFAAVVAAFARTREQVVPIGLAVAFILASIGGLLWPLYNMPRWMQEGARLLITTWSMFGIQDVMLRERSLSGVSTELLVLVGYGLVCFLIAVRLFRYGDQKAGTQ